MSQPVAPPASIPMQPVESSNLAAIGYDAPSQCVQVQFKTGAIWRYHAVPKETYAGLETADSKGSYFTRCIKTCFPAEKLKG